MCGGTAALKSGMRPEGCSLSALSSFCILQQNDYSGPGPERVGFVPIASPVLFYF